MSSVWIVVRRLLVVRMIWSSGTRGRPCPTGRIFIVRTIKPRCHHTADTRISRSVLSMMKILLRPRRGRQQRPRWGRTCPHMGLLSRIWILITSYRMHMAVQPVRRRTRRIRSSVSYKKGPVSPPPPAQTGQIKTKKSTPYHSFFFKCSQQSLYAQKPTNVQGSSRRGHNFKPQAKITQVSV